MRRELLARYFGVRVPGCLFQDAGGGCVIRLTEPEVVGCLGQQVLKARVEFRVPGELVDQEGEQGRSFVEQIELGLGFGGMHERVEEVVELVEAEVEEGRRGLESEQTVAQNEEGVASGLGHSHFFEEDLVFEQCVINGDEYGGLLATGEPLEQSHEDGVGGGQQGPWSDLEQELHNLSIILREEVLLEIASGAARDSSVPAFCLANGNEEHVEVGVLLIC